jgi:hypothetical protein
MTEQERQEAKGRIETALKAASSLMVVEVWAPPEHQFEKENRFKAREYVQKLCIAAQADLQRLFAN